MSSSGTQETPASSSPSGVAITAQQEKVLEQEFKQEKNWDDITLELVVAECGLCEKDVEKWYSWRKNEWRRTEGLRIGSGSLTDM
ncbi:homeodomain-only protein [Strongylocentrotus purpuratus]|uniref:Homeodomain-only protein n=1 Tax=Strongylocentrotus purpuratus TaxID=7668 RepID=A0A7M7GHQ5_STRPU|nr:homeodomain-only protein [Strongylocentrotus purpuratus]